MGAGWRIMAGLESGSRLAAVFGGPGTGKTLLMRRMERELTAKGWAVQSAYRAVFSFQEFLHSCCKSVGTDSPPQGLNAQLNAIHKRLGAMHTRMAILLDEAESTRDQVLDAITRLSQLDANGGPQIQVVVFGQQALSRKLQALTSRPSFELKASLRPYSTEEISAYMLWHLRECGMDPRATFSSGAVAEIAASSGGTPGRINLLAASSMLEAQLAGTLPVSPALVNAVAGDLGIYAVSASHDETSWFRDSSLDNAELGAGARGPGPNMELFDPSTPEESGQSTDWEQLEDVLPDESSMSLLERAAPLIQNPFAEAFDDADALSAGMPAERSARPGGDRRAAPRPGEDPEPLPTDPAAQNKAPPAPPDRLDLDLSRALDDAATGQPDNGPAEFSLDSLALEERGKPLLAPAPATPTIDEAMTRVAHRHRSPTGAAPAQEGASPGETLPGTPAAFERYSDDTSLGDDSHPTLTQAHDGLHVVPRRLAVERSARTRTGRRVLRTGFALVLLVILAALILRATGVPPAVSAAWSEHAPAALRPLPAEVDRWLDAMLANLPWPARTELPIPMPQSTRPPPGPASEPPAPVTSPPVTSSTVEAAPNAGDAGTGASDAAMPDTESTVVVAATSEPSGAEVADVGTGDGASDAEQPGHRATMQMAEPSAEPAPESQIPESDPPESPVPESRAPESEVTVSAGVSADRLDDDSTGEIAQAPTVSRYQASPSPADPATESPNPIETAADAAYTPEDSGTSAAEAVSSAASSGLSSAEAGDSAAEADANIEFSIDTASTQAGAAGATPSTATPAAEPEAENDGLAAATDETSAAAPATADSGTPPDGAPEWADPDPAFSEQAAAAPRRALRPEPPLLASGVHGIEDEPVRLVVKVGHQLTGTPLTLELHGVPRGATVEGAQLQGAVWRAPSSNSAALTLTPPRDSDRDFALSWRLIDDESGELLDTARSTVLVQAKADPPALTAKASAGDQYTAIPLEIDVASNDRDGSERLSIVISGLPPSAPLTPGRQRADGTWLLSPNQLQGLIVTPGAGAPSRIDVTVTAVATERNNGDEARTEAQVSFQVVPSTP
ncbi:MAG: AAA family ATPase [Gammaproteobacteria bacterium]